MSGTLSVLPSAELQNIPAMMRTLADEIEAGAYGPARACVVVLDAEKHTVFGFGRCPDAEAHMLLGLSMRYLEEERSE